MISENMRLKMLVSQIRSDLRSGLNPGWKDIHIKTVGTRLAVIATPILNQVKFRISIKVESDSIVPILTCKDCELEVQIKKFSRSIVKAAEEDRDTRIKYMIL